MSSRNEVNTPSDEPQRRARRPSAKQRELDEAEEATQSRKAQKRAAETSDGRTPAAKSGKKARVSHVDETPTFATQTVTSSKPKSVPFKHLTKRVNKVPPPTTAKNAKTTNYQHSEPRQAPPQNAASRRSEPRSVTPGPRRDTPRSGRNSARPRNTARVLDSSDDEGHDEDHVPRRSAVDPSGDADAVDDDAAQHYQDDGDANFDQELEYEEPVQSSPPRRQSHSQERFASDDESPDAEQQIPEDASGSDAEGGDGNDSDAMDAVHCPEPIHTPSRRGPRAKDYDEDVQDVLDIANSLFRCRISTVNAFPSDSLQDEWAQQCWGEACRKLDIKYAANRAMIKIVTARGSQLRGELKNKVKPLVESLYGFDSSSARRAMRKNRDRATALTHESAFAYEDPALNQPEGTYAERKGIYRHPIIQKAINATWFANRADEGIIFRQFFEPAISIETIALVLTAVHCCIDEWGPGRRTLVDFTENDYKTVYLSHRDNLRAFDELGDDAHLVLLKLRKRLYAEARFHSGAEDIDRSFNTLSRDALSHALQEALLASAGDDNEDADGT
ncbi:uncharacterized protein B0H18DRAFT_1119321 [Fomitopsis serialis]|uniref:uncharacterized protein n=1 Tax=Fomitopsis serialis TaxID=139415 RepID=UPI0020081A5C|nr:uncharacterized protein B0H18DRAFT_1119321 [Neoantrodia serialis]KAH9925841.1 hypothetical protein B0H18DRAFT_1119321 [Neoantrodia serialis]